MDNEYAVIGAMLGDIECAERGFVECVSDDFCDFACRKLFEIMAGMHSAGDAVDLVTVGSRVSAENWLMPTYGKVVSAFWIASNFDGYVSELKRARRFRELEAGLNRSMAMVRAEDDGVFSETQKMLDQVQAVGADGMDTVGCHVDTAFAEIGERKRGMSTGFYDIDNNTGGLVAGNLCVVAGRPSMGKSTFAINVAQNVCTKGGTVAYFSLEDDVNSVVRRMIFARAKSSALDIQRGDQEAIKRAIEAKEAVKGYALHVCDSGALSVSQIARSCYALRQRKHIDLVVVDYLGLVRTNVRKNSTRQQEIGEVSRGMKMLAKNLGCTVMLVAQLNRQPDSRDDKRPRMSDLRESGDVEQDADVILFPFRPWVYDHSKDKETASVIIAKNRNGRIGEAPLYWHGEWFLFENVGASEQFKTVQGELPTGW